MNDCGDYDGKVKIELQECQVRQEEGAASFGTTSTTNESQLVKSTSGTVSPNAQEDENESSDEKKLIPKDKVALKETTEVLSKTKISFDYDKDIPIIEDYNNNINRTVEILKDNPNFGLQIEAYSDNTGSEEHQRDLARRRVNNVMQIFIGKGAPANQISTVTYTSSDPQFKLYFLEGDEHRCAIFRIFAN